MRDTIIKGMLGTATASGSLVVSVASEIEIWLRIVALLIGIAVSLLTFYSIWKKL